MTASAIRQPMACVIWSVAALGRDIVGRIGLRGVAKLDFKRDQRGNLHLLEVNPRFNLWHHPGAVAGVNIPAFVYADLADLPRPVVRPARPGARWCSMSKDLRSARASGISLLEWIPWAIGCDAKSVVSWDDPMPYIALKLARLRHLVTGALPREGTRL
jgi:D-aspartate ligase